MASYNGSPPVSRNRTASTDDSVLGSTLTSRHIEAFSRKLTTTATQLVGDGSTGIHYQHAMSELHRELHRPGLQRRILSYTQASPTELVRSKLFTNEIQHRAVAHIPDDVLSEIPEEAYDYSLFQGFEATIPQSGESEHRKKHKRHSVKTQKLLEGALDEDEVTALGKAKKEQRLLNRKLEMMAVRKNMCSSEIREIDSKITNLNGMRRIVLERLEDLEQEEVQLERDLQEMEYKLDDLRDEAADQVSESQVATPVPELEEDNDITEEETSFMSQSIYEKLPSPKAKRHKATRRKSMAIRHEHFDPGTAIAEFQAHSDMITSLDFDAPFGTMVSSALDDTVRVWDLNAGRCIGLLEGHQASVRCLQVDESLVATGSMDASIRLWDLDQIEYTPRQGRAETEQNEGGDESAPPPSSSSTADCHILTLTAHVAEITALNFHGDSLVSGSADKTLRQWDLVKGRCVQTLDVLWAAAQASATISPPSNSSNTRSKSPSKLPAQWQNAGSRVPDPSADFVGALQCFDAALACGTADGMVRLWDLRSGQVHRSLVGHTGAVTSLQFDERVLVTGSADRSIRIWDLRTGSIRDAYAYENPITSMMFDSRRIVAAAGENTTKVYDKTDGRHWDCGPGQGALVERVRVRDGYLVGGRKDGIVSVFSC